MSETKWAVQPKGNGEYIVTDLASHGKRVYLAVIFDNGAPITVRNISGKRPTGLSLDGPTATSILAAVRRTNETLMRELDAVYPVRR